MQEIPSRLIKEIQSTIPLIKRDKQWKTVGDKVIPLKLSSFLDVNIPKENWNNLYYWITGGELLKSNDEYYIVIEEISITTYPLGLANFLNLVIFCPKTKSKYLTHSDFIKLVN